MTQPLGKSASAGGASAASVAVGTAPQQQQTTSTTSTSVRQLTESKSNQQLSAHVRQPSAASLTASTSAAAAVSVGGASPSLSLSKLKGSGSSSNLKSLTSPLNATGSSGGLSGSDKPKGSWSPGTIATIDCKNCHFVLMDAPTNQTLPNYLGVLRERSVHQLVRCCEPSYDIAPLTQNQIAVHELYYKDGDGPPQDVIQRWLSLVTYTFKPPAGGGGSGTANGGGGGGGAKSATTPPGSVPSSGTEAIAVHCVAGLGRAPTLIAIALIELCGMNPIDAVSFIRKRRRGAFNSKQLAWLETYQKQSASNDGCIVM